MKKLLALVLVLVLSLAALTACSPKDAVGKVKDTVGGWFGKEPADDGNDTGTTTKNYAEMAVNYLNTLYKEADKKTAANYELPATIAVEGGAITLKVVWTASVDSVVIAPKENDESKVTVTIPAVSADLAYTITATITDTNGNTKSVSFDRIVPSVDTYMTPAEYYAAAESAEIKVKGIVTGIDSKSYGDNHYNCLYVQDESGNGGYYVYSMTKDPVADLHISIGMTVKIVGVKHFDYDVSQVNDATVTVLDTTVKTVTPVDFTTIYSGAASLKDTALVSKTGMLVTIKGAELTTQDSGEKQQYYKFKLGALESYVRIYKAALTDSDATALKQKHTDNMGKLADVTGVITFFKGEFYLNPVSVDAFSNFKESPITDADKIAAELNSIKFYGAKKDQVIDLVVSGATYKNVTISWTSNNACAVVSADGKTLNVYTQDTEQIVTLTASAKIGDMTPVTKTFELKVSAAPDFVVSVVENPAVDTEYYLYLDHTKRHEDMFFTGKMDGYYFATTGTLSQAVKVKLVDAGDGKYYLTGYADGVQWYFNIQSEYSTKDKKIYNNVTRTDSAISKFEFDTTLKTLKTTTTVKDGDGKEVTETFIFGTSATSTHQTISANKVGSASSTCIAYLVIAKDVTAMSDADKVAAQKDALALGFEQIKENSNVELPRRTVKGVTVTWTSADVTVTNNVAAFVLAAEEKTVTLTATITCGQASATATFTVKVAAKLAEGTVKFDLDTIETDTSYGTKTSTDGWVAENAATNKPEENMGFKVIVLNGKTTAVGTLTSPKLTGPFEYITFNYTNIYGETNGVDITVQIIVNGQVVEEKQLDNDTVTKFEVYEFTYTLKNPIAAGTEYQIKIVNNSPTQSTSNKDRVSIWNLLLHPKAPVSTDTTTPAEKVATEKAALTLPTADVNVNKNISLPTATQDDVTIEWTSNNDAIKVDNGKLVINIDALTADVVVTVKATISAGEGDKKVTDEKTFEIKLVYVSPENRVASEKEALKLPLTATSVNGKLELPKVKNYTNVKIEWASDNDAVKVENNKYLVVNMPEANATVTITAVITCGESKDKKTFEFKLNVPAYTLNNVTETTLATDKAYKLYIAQVQKGQNYFANGKKSGNFFGTTTNLLEAIDVYLEAVTGGYRIYFKNADGSKTYYDVYEYTTNKVGVQMTGEPNCVYVWKEEIKSFVTEVTTTDGTAKTYYLGAYNTNVNLGSSEIKYVTGDNAANVGLSQYVAYLAEVVCAHTYTNDCDESCNVCGAKRTVSHKYDADCDPVCNVCGATRTPAADHVDTDGNGKCDNTGCKYVSAGAGATTPWVEPEMDDEGTTVTEKTVTAKYPGGTTGNMGDSNEAATLGLDATVFTVIGNKCTPSNNVGLNQNGDFRLYHDSSAANGTELTISVAAGRTIKSIKITFTSASYAANCQISVGGTAVKTTDGSSVEVEVDINASAFVLKNVSTTKQIRIANIEIVYTEA